MSTQILPLDPDKRSTDTMEFQTALRSKIVGQEEGVQALVDLYQVFCAGLNSPGRPVGNLLFLGPTGSGKTRIVEAAAEILFGDPRAVIKIDCAEFQHSHEIAKLIGSPPGYLGHRETHPLITQEELAKNHTEKLKLSFLLFDEIEKASDALWQLLLGMLDKATLTLGDNRRVDLSQTVIFMTSNLGGGEITELMQGGMGFIQPKDKPVTGLDEKVERTAVEAARRKFSPEFMNRLDKVVVFHPLQRAQLEEVLEIELGQVQQRVLETARGQFLFRVTPAARDFLLLEGTDQRYGARHLKRAIERNIVYPLANLLATEQVKVGDLVRIDWDGVAKNLSFDRESEGALVETPEPIASRAAAMAEARDGKAAETPAAATAESAAAGRTPPAAAPAAAPQGRKSQNATDSPPETSQRELRVEISCPALLKLPVGRAFRTRDARFRRGGADGICFSALTLRLYETQSHSVRRFPELQWRYVIESALLLNRGGRITNGLSPAQ